METAKKLTWEEIEQHYDKEFVQLIDYDWNPTEPYPSGGVVRIHAKTRKEFNKLMLQDPPKKAAYVFVGKWPAPDNVVVNYSLMGIK